jgi:hypothetical protein
MSFLPHRPTLRLLCTGALLLASAALAAPPAAPVDAATFLKQIDAAHRKDGDLKILSLIEERQGSVQVVRQILSMTREPGDENLLLITKPKTQQGNGYLSIGQNLWYYDAGIGRWFRRTSHERIAGTNAHASDLGGAPPLSLLYNAEDSGTETVGGQAMRVLTLKAKPGLDVDFPIQKIWVDPKLNIVRTEDRAASGKLLRISYSSKFVNVLANAGLKGEVWVPQEIRIFDQVEKDRSTLISFKSFDLHPLEPNTFTKAWLEGKSR